jgi:hypothetical protein
VTLQRIILTFKPEGVEIRTVHRTKDGPGPKPGLGSGSSGR